MKVIYLLVGAFLASSPLHADIYKWTDSNGNVHFSDKPHAGAEQIQLPKIQTYSPPASNATDSETIKETTDSVPAYEKVAIVQPEDQITIRNTDGSVTIVLAIKPELAPGDKLQLIFDGSPIGTPQPTPIFTLRNINRGSHTIAAQVVNPEGLVLATSDSITIFMQQPRVGMGATGRRAP